jgi:hypothetical protein
LAWGQIQPYLADVRNTSYYRYYLMNLRQLFNLDEADLFSDRWEAASNALLSYSRENRGNGRQLCEKWRIEAVIIDAKMGLAQLAPTEQDDGRIRQVVRMDMFVHEERGLKKLLEDRPARNFNDWTGYFDEIFSESMRAGAIGFKCGLAYNRSLGFATSTRDRAARVFEAGLLSGEPSDRTVYQDYMVNRLCRLCEEAGVPLQIHTGLHSGVFQHLENAKPTLLTELLRNHRELKVDLLHGGYPWCVQAGIMAKYFPEVYVNGCWLHHISPSAYHDALRSWIDIVPMSKIFAWGGDHTLLENSLASLLLAKDTVAGLLANLIDEDAVDLDLALEIARRGFHDNPVRFWGLERGGESSKKQKARRRRKLR